MTASYDRMQRVSTWGAVVVSLLLIVAGWYALQLKFGTEYVENWLPANTPTRVAYTDFSRRFGGDQVLLLTWSEANLQDSRLQSAYDQLEQLRQQNPDWPIVSITHSLQTVEKLQEKLHGLSQAAAIRRLAGQAVGADGSSFIAIQVRGLQPKERDQMIAALYQLARGLGIANRDIVIAGEPYQTHIVDFYSRLSVERFVPLSVLLAMVAAWLCLRSWRLTLMVMALAGLGQMLGMALISATMGQMGAIMIVVPTLLFMLTLSASVHLVNYYVDCRHSGLSHPGLRALKMGAWPCFLSALTTSFGFISLVVSDLEPVFQFGLLAGIGILVTTLILLLLFVPATRIQAIGHREQPDEYFRPFRWAEGLIALTSGRSWTIIAVTLLVCSAAAWGLPRLQTTTRFDGMFDEGHPSVRSLRWVESRLGPIETMEFLITFPEQQPDVDLIDQLAVVQQLQAAINSQSSVHSTFSAINLLPSLPLRHGSRATIQRSVYRKVITDDLGTLESAQLISTKQSGTSWRITARFKTSQDDQFHQLKSELQAVAQRQLESQIESPAQRPTLEITGLRTVIETANSVLMQDLISSFATAFLLITPAMMLLVRSFWGGLLIMIPNILPVVLVFGVMGWALIPLDVASILTASVALGIAVDDTLHCVYWFLRSRKAGASLQGASAEAIRHCGRAMWFTTLISTCAMLPFIFCEFLPTGKFALLLILILMSAIIGDLLLLPAMMSSRLGRWMGPATNHDNSAA